jgi:hypothetical protein
LIHQGSDKPGGSSGLQSSEKLDCFSNANKACTLKSIKEVLVKPSIGKATKTLALFFDLELQYVRELQAAVSHGLQELFI